jgi:hypothetical protein
MIVERNKQIKVESHSNLQEKTAADDRADYNNYNTCQSLSYMEISTLHLKYPSKYTVVLYSICGLPDTRYQSKKLSVASS